MSKGRTPVNLGHIEITWLEPESQGYTDFLPLVYFSERCRNKIVNHEVRGPRGGAMEAKCQLTVQNRSAQLNYAAFPEFNRKHGMYLGTMHLRFADGDRTAIEKVFWNDENSTSKYLPVRVEVEMCPAPVLVPYRQPKLLDTVRSRRLVRERPGQIEFRKKLKFAYENKCCISACAIPEALDGAHIDAYGGPLSDHPQNGLLLRRDLHALFDAGLLTVHYESLLVHLAPEIRNCADYRRYNQTLISCPQSEDYAPSREALKRRWLQFRQQFKINLEK